MIRRVPAALCAALMLQTFAAVSASAAARPVAAEDLFKLSFVSDPQIDPAGTRVAFIVSRMNGPKNRYDSDLYLVPASGGAPTRITRTGRDSSPAWSPDGSTVAFVRGPSKKGERAQIFAYDVRTGKTKQLTHLRDGASDPLYSHSGRQLLFTSVTVDAPPSTNVDFRAAGFSPSKAERKSDVRVIREMHFDANGAGYIYDRHAHLWVMNADGSGVRALTGGTQWSEGGARWSPDDKTIAFNSLRYHSPSLGPNDVYTMPAAGGAMQRLPSNQPANDLLDYDRAGNLWYFSGGVMDPAEFPMLVRSQPNGTGRAVVIGKNVHDFGDAVLADMGEPGGFCGPYFAPNDAFAIADLNVPGYSAIVRVDPRSGSVTPLTSGGEASECSMDERGRYVSYTFSDFTHPRDVYLLDLQSGRSRRLTAFNDAYLRSVALSTPERFTVADDAGFTVQAWFMPALRGSGPRPTLLDIHGGPETQFGSTFFHEFQYWAGLGYNVVFSDPRGSVGFGYPFEEALAKHWGAAMFDDVQRVMDAAIKRPSVDANRLGVLGGSYGGYATLWVVGHTNRYKAAIAERVVSNLATEQLAADLASDNALGGRYSWGLPWERGNSYLEQSPISYVGDAVTPLLILHSEEDTRTPIDQTLQWFNAEKILGRPIEYVVFPDENHDLSRTGSPIHRVERLRMLSQWMQTYLTP